MKTSAYNLNLLHESERRSSSPVRMRVMLPLLLMFAAAALAVDWGVSFTRRLLLDSKTQALKEAIDSRRREHAETLRQRAELTELELELSQLAAYSNGVRHVGGPLALLAEKMPVNIQLCEIAVSALPPQNLQPPKPRMPPLFGPRENCETQRVSFVGRAVSEKPLQDMLASLQAEPFAGFPGTGQRINSVRQESSTDAEGRRLLSFEVEWTLPPRRFEP